MRNVLYDQRKYYMISFVLDRTFAAMVSVHCRAQTLLCGAQIRLTTKTYDKDNVIDINVSSGIVLTVESVSSCDR